MSTSSETQAKKGTTKGCWDYSPEEMRAMSRSQAADLFSLQMQGNARVAREKAEQEKAAN